MSDRDLKTHLLQKLDIWLHEWGKGTALLGAFAAIAALWIIYGQPERHYHDGYSEAEVIVTFDISTDDGFGLSAHVRLADGTQTTVRTRSLVMASEVLDTACLERRRTESGLLRYQLAPWANCTREPS